MEECESTNVLLVEGTDDCNIIHKFCKDNSIDENSFSFCNCKGDNQVLNKLTGLLKSSEKPEIIGIILDADTDINDRYDDIKSKLAQYELPEKFPKEYLIVKKEGLPKIGVWIMPNNKDNGALEDFFFEVTKINTTEIKKCIQSSNQTTFKSQHLNKAIMHTYFAWQDNPGASLCKAINKIVLNNDSQTANKFKTWLVTLFKDRRIRYEC